MGWWRRDEGQGKGSWVGGEEEDLNHTNLWYNMAALRWSAPPQPDAISTHLDLHPHPSIPTYSLNVFYIARTYHRSALQYFLPLVYWWVDVKAGTSTSWTLLSLCDIVLMLWEICTNNSDCVYLISSIFKCTVDQPAACLCICSWLKSHVTASLENLHRIDCFW